MLLSALSLACLLAAHVVNGQDTCSLMGTKPLRVTEKSNYIIDYFSGQLLFAYAIDKCTATNIIPGLWYKYVCAEADDGTWSVSKTKYTDSACTKGATAIGSYKEGDSMEGEVGYFECTGDDNFVQVEVSINPDCSGSQVVSAGLGGCTDNSPLLTEFYCDDTQALFQLYIDPASLTSSTAMASNETLTTSTTENGTTETPTSVVCNPALYCDKWTFVAKCNPVAKILGNTIYGKLDKCSIFSSAGLVNTSTSYVDDEHDSSTTSPSTTDGAHGGNGGNGGGSENAASSLFIITNLAFALTVTLFSLF